MNKINPWLLAGISFGSGFVIGLLVALWWVVRKIKKLMGIKSWKDFENMIKKSKDLEKKMKKGSISEMMNDPQIKKQLEEFAKLILNIFL